MNREKVKRKDLEEGVSRWSQVWLESEQVEIIRNQEICIYTVSSGTYTLPTEKPILNL